MKKFLLFIANNSIPIFIISVSITMTLILSSIAYFDDPKAKAAFAASIKYNCNEKKVKISLKKSKYHKRVYILNVCGQVKIFACDTGWHGCKSYGCYEEVPQ